jgi:perosamine synthetase
LNYEETFLQMTSINGRCFSYWKGRVALFAILSAMKISKGDEVITPGYTCVVVPNAIRFTGATPIYVDNADGTYHIDPKLVLKSITRKTKAIIIQHTYGIPGPLEEISEISQKHGIPFIEDCAHSISSSINNQTLGSCGIASFFSSQWSKPYTTGLGGLAVANDIGLQKDMQCVLTLMKNPPIKEQIKLSIEYFLFDKFFTSKRYWQAQNLLHIFSNIGIFVGSSSNDELNGEMPSDHYWMMGENQKKAGKKKILNFGNNLTNRRELTAFYDESLRSVKWKVAYRKGDTIFLRYPIRVANKDELLEKAKHSHIEIGSWFETPLHPIPLSQHSSFQYRLGQCPNAESDAGRVVNLPLHEHINLLEAQRIVRFIFDNAVPINVF